MITGFITFAIIFLMLSIISAVQKSLKKSAEEKAICSREFSLSKEIVFDAVCNVLPSIGSVKIESMNKISGIVNLKSKLTLTSFGESIQVKVIYLSENNTLLEVKSTVTERYWDVKSRLEKIEEIMDAISSHINNL